MSDPANSNPIPAPAPESTPAAAVPASVPASAPLTPSSPPPAPVAADVAEDRTAAILSYVTLFGFIVAIILHTQKKTALGAFHLRQALGLIIASFGAGIAVMILAMILAFIPLLGPLLVLLLWIGLMVATFGLAIMGLIAAVQGRQTPLPVIGEPIQKYLGNTFT